MQPSDSPKGNNGDLRHLVHHKLSCYQCVEGPDSQGRCSSMPIASDIRAQFAQLVTAAVLSQATVDMIV